MAVKFGKIRVKHLVHRLIASAFCDGFDPDLSVNHKNGNKKDNVPENLEWCTLAENTRHQWKTALITKERLCQSNSKVEPTDVILIRDLYDSKEPVADIAKRFMISKSAVYLIGKRERWGWL